MAGLTLHHTIKGPTIWEGLHMKPPLFGLSRVRYSSLGTSRAVSGQAGGMSRLAWSGLLEEHLGRLGKDARKKYVSAASVL